MKPRFRTILPVLLILLGSCSTTRVLEEGEYLFRKNEIVVESEEGTDSRAVGKALSGYAQQKTNKKFLGLFPVRLWLFNLPGDSVPERGLEHWIKHKLGEPPVLYRGYQEEATIDRIGSALQNRGYFHYRIDPQKRIKDKKLTMVYRIDLERPYLIGKVRYPEPSDTLTRLIRSYREGSLVRTGDQYRLETMMEERERITGKLEEAGFFYLVPDYLFFSLDSSGEDRKIDVELLVRRDIPPEAGEIQYINRVFVHHGVSVQPDEEAGDTLFSHGMYHIHPGGMKLKPRILKRSVLLEPGQHYDERNYRKSLRKLTELGIYQFVNIRFSETGDTGRSELDADIYLSDDRRRRLQAEVQAVSKSNDFAGPGLVLSYTNRNVNRNATGFRLDLNSGFETQLSGNVSGINSIEAGTHGELAIPRILAPGALLRRFRDNPGIPGTRIRAGYNYFSRSNLFTLNSINASYGYYWEQSDILSHDLKIFSLDYLKLSNVSPSLEGSSLLRRNYPEQFITMVRYSFTLNDLVHPRKINHYLHMSAEASGNILSGVDAVFSGSAPEQGAPSSILGVPYTQYARIFSDYRIYYTISSASKLVSRFFFGLGLPYGNSAYMPYKKQFYSGGTTSLRAFPSRSVGPGSFYPGDSLDARSYLDQTGDIKLELNLEYRFDIYRFLKGALFLDAGNIWLVNEDPDKPGGAFRSSVFLNQMAAGTGLGLRFDLSVLVLRLDMGIPLRKPWRPDGERWVLDAMDITDPAWRKENLVFNFALGYPF